MPKKDYKRKRSKILTKQRKEVKDPQIEKTTDSINSNSGVWKIKKK